jgi:type IV pilus assembly protein PilN
VILINLLPHREERRKRRKAAFFAGLGVAAVAGLAIVGVWFLLVQQLTAAQQERNQFLTAEIKKLEVQIKDIATLKAEIESLKARQKAVENLQTDRNIPVHVLNELVRQTPEGIYFTSVKQDGQVLVLTGIAQTNERVSELLRNTANNSQWLTRPELVEIKVASLQAANREQKRLYEFSEPAGCQPRAEAPV